MKTGTVIGIIVGLFILLGIGYFFWQISVKNSIINKDEASKAQWALVESAYQRRADLIPNLVNTVKGASEFERETLESVVQARSKATSVNINADNINPQTIQKFQAAQDQLGGALSRLLVTVERYPELKATANYSQLQSQLEGTENRIKIERDRFNAAVADYNAYIRKFPGRLFAAELGAEKKGFFESAKGTENAPTVEF